MRKSRWIAVLLAGASLLVAVTAVSALTYRVQWGDTLSRIASRFGVSINEIVAANPTITNPNLIFAGQDIEIPAAGETPPPPPPPETPPPSGVSTYTVQRGDTLSAIARRFGTTVAAIAQENGLVNVNLIYVGQVLRIPGGSEPPSNPPPGSGSFALGGQTLNLAFPDEMNEAGMTWAKFQVKWSPGDQPSAWEDEIEAAHDNNFKVLLSVTGADSYPAAGSINFNSYVEFVRGLAALGPDAIEIWNEMNIDFEWPAGEISPSSYVNNMLAPAYNAINSVNGDILVISGAPAPTGFDNGTNAWADDRYLAGMRNAGAASYADCIGVHHNAGATSPLVQTGHPGGAHYSWYFQPTLNLYRNAFSGSRPLCLTELGYVSGEGLGDLPAGFGWASGTSVAEQAQWLAEAAQAARSRGDVRLAIVYNVDFDQFGDNDPQAGYAIIRPGGDCPACATLGDVMGP